MAKFTVTSAICKLCVAICGSHSVNGLLVLYTSCVKTCWINLPSGSFVFGPAVAFYAIAEEEHEAEHARKRTVSSPLASGYFFFLQ